MSVLLVVFILCSIGVYLSWNNDPRFVAFFGGTTDNTLSDNWELQSPPEAIGTLRVATLDYSRAYASSGFLYGSKDDCKDYVEYGFNSTVLWRELFASKEGDIATDCGYTLNISSVTGNNFTGKQRALQAMLTSPCRDDLVMMNDRARAEANRLASGIPIPGLSFFVNHYMIGYDNSITYDPHQPSTCQVMFNSRNNERVYCAEADMTLGVDLNCSTSTMPILGTHTAKKSTKGMLGIFYALDGMFTQGFYILDNIPVVNGIVPFLTMSSYDTSSLYAATKDIFLMLMWIAAILFVLTCVWAVYASHRTF
jgi:hypothetical protein